MGLGRQRETVMAAVALHDAVFDDAERFTRLHPDVDRVLGETDGPRAAVRALEACWADLVAVAFRDARKYDELRARLRADDPVLQSVGLLELLGRPRREILHTAAIAGLISPDTVTGVGRLRALLELVLKDSGTDVPERLEGATVAVNPVYRKASGATFVSVIPDLRIQVGSLIVIIENKVDAIDREGQLSSYSDAVRVHHDDAEPVFVYLTPHGDAPAEEDGREWIVRSYRELALRWRALLAADEAAGHRWSDAARAYMTTMTRTICGWQMDDVRSPAERARVVPYLREATGGST
jgi:hypothetical protein